MADFSQKSGMVHDEFVLPGDAPDWARALIADRSVAGASEAFWNEVEAFETRKDAQLAKEFILALPRELTAEQNIAMMREFVAEPRRCIDEGAENDGAILTAKSRLHDEAAELDLLARILLPGFRL